MFVCCEYCVLSVRGLCDGLITRPEELYRLWRIVCDQKASYARRLQPRYRAAKYKPKMDCSASRKKLIFFHPEEEKYDSPKRLQVYMSL